MVGGDAVGHVPSDLAGPPAGPLPVPDAVTAAVRDALPALDSPALDSPALDSPGVEAVWVNGLGGVTFAVLEHGRPVAYVKWMPPTAEVEGPHDAEARMLDLTVEAARLRWAGRFTPVPEVLAVGHADADGPRAGEQWLVTRALPGRSAVDPRWLADPRTAVRAVGAGLRALHDALPVDPTAVDAADPTDLAAEDAAGQPPVDAPAPTGPGDWSVEARLAVGQATGRLDADRAAALAAAAPPVDRLVVCHGDACAPNTLVADDGTWAGHVDLGSLGVADRWADLAVATWSTVWNYGPGWEG